MYEEASQSLFIVYLVFDGEDVESDPIYPTPPLWQDMTQGQFLSGV